MKRAKPRKLINKIVLSLFYVFLIIVYAKPSVAIDLEAPLERKKITAKSEIIRGYSIILESTRKIPSVDTKELLYSISDIITINQQNNTDSEPFLLGAYFSAWSNISIRLEAISKSIKEHGPIPNELKYRINVDKLINEAINYYYLFRKLQKKFNITDYELIQILNLNENHVIPLLYKWERMSKPK